MNRILNEAYMLPAMEGTLEFISIVYFQGRLSTILAFRHFHIGESSLCMFSHIRTMDITLKHILPKFIRTLVFWGIGRQGINQMYEI